MKQILHTLVLCSLVNFCLGQNYTFERIPEGIVTVSGDERAGSCASPNGAIVCLGLDDFPTLAEIAAMGCCYTISPAVKNATYCYTFTCLGTEATLNCGFSVTGTGGYSYWFSDFNLYTCDPDCVLQPAYGSPVFTYTGLTPGQCYTWCFQTHMTGGGASGGFTSLCPYYIGDAVLPIDLTSFTAAPGNGFITLNWTIASETNCSEYQVLRSIDGVTFEKIGTIPGGGTSSSELQYSFTDDAPRSGTAYYQLKQFDYDLNFTQSEIIACDFKEEIISIKYYTYSGQVVDFSVAPAGIYICETITSLSRYSKQVVKN